MGCKRHWTLQELELKSSPLHESKLVDRKVGEGKGMLQGRRLGKGGGEFESIKASTDSLG